MPTAANSDTASLTTNAVPSTADQSLPPLQVMGQDYIGWRQVQANIEASKAQALAAIADPSQVAALTGNALAMYQHQLRIRQTLQLLNR
jgi:hypothetical protein